jgi:hypothetical protein
MEVCFSSGWSDKLLMNIFFCSIRGRIYIPVMELLVGGELVFLGNTNLLGLARY